MTVTVRFAPSPTGKLHAGNIRTALINWTFARKAGGRFLLRLDDTDAERSTEAFAQGIREDLTWLSLGWDQETKQSDRFDRYAAAVERLKGSGRLYPAYETQEELEAKRKRQLARGRPPVYDRAALKLTEAERAKLKAEGRAPHWRFLLETRDVVWNDLVRGEQHVDAASLSDPVLVRADGTYLYTLPSVVDDIELGITHVIRGEDHVANTAPQLQLFEALGATPPAFGHHSLLVSAEGQALSKREGALSIGGLREEGLEPLAVASYTASIGTSDPVAPHASLDEIASAFAFAKLSRAPARFDVHELRGLNARLLHGLPYDAVAERLAAMGVTGSMGVGGGEGFWEAVRANLTTLGDAAAWWGVVSEALPPVIEDVELCRQAAKLLPPEPWDEGTWTAWTSAVKEATGAKGKALFGPLRLALTGREHGPELKLLLPLIGRDRAAARLEGKTA
jgi:glutamyl-tRNA synthetase